ncbi:MAG: hypothetical protein ABI706_18460 [Ilumatobacteraceae bacterium]
MDANQQTRWNHCALEALHSTAGHVFVAPPFDRLSLNWPDRADVAPITAIHRFESAVPAVLDVQVISFRG